MFAILFEVLLIEIQEEIHHFAGWEGGGLRGAKIVHKNFVNKLAFPKGGILWAWGFSSRKNEKICQAPIKLAQPFPAPELRAEILWTPRFF